MSYDQGFRYSMQNCLYESVLNAIIEIYNCKPSFVNFDLAGMTLKTCRNNELYGAREIMDNIGNDNFTYEGKRYDLTKARTNDTNEEPKKCYQRCEMQEQNLMSTSSSYPNKLTFPYRDDFCLILKKVTTKVCSSTYRTKAFLNRYSKQISCGALNTSIGYFHPSWYNYRRVESILAKLSTQKGLTVLGGGGGGVTRDIFLCDLSFLLQW